MARAEGGMRLMLGQLKEVYGVAKPFAREPLRPEHRVLIRDRRGELSARMARRSSGFLNSIP